MSITPVTDVTSVVSRPRVRHQAREAAALMVFSAATSMTIAGALVLLAHWGR
jgi:hypothetical protein